ncbi:hypothetical protein GCM10007301_23280 [Azorhizobium oxalatiphilum]|uniref:Uncharacterized protein n=1 Tax=Azorhizobium oxalatiphilum TaxID=980631 RepID=A0A917BZ68_9HYPH|nr:RNA polymerase sigma factor [Azorhizobium oxalatiphilum]GGF62878.1 hypothetical protein GCM10007301_23280 [Azorhizobium oxalatiphilum]
MLGTWVHELQRTEEDRLRRFFLRRFRDRSDAFDATQETFLRLLSATPRGVVENPKAYLFQTARNIAYDQTASRRRREQVECPITDEQAVLNIASDAPSPERVLIDKQRLELFERALMDLPVRVRTVVILSRLEGWSYPAIAEHLRVSPNTVYNDMRMGMAHCVAAMARAERR